MLCDSVMGSKGTRKGSNFTAYTNVSEREGSSSTVQQSKMALTIKEILEKESNMRRNLMRTLIHHAVRFRYCTS